MDDMSRFLIRYGTLQKKNSIALDSPVSCLKGIGEKKTSILKIEAGITTIEDLLYYSPRRYIDRSALRKIIECNDGEDVTVSGTITGCSISVQGKKRIIVTLSDGTDILSMIFFGNIFYFKEKFTEGLPLIISGKINIHKNKKQIFHPEYDFCDDGFNVNTGRIVPLYRSTEKLSRAGFDSRGFRKLLKELLYSHKIGITDFLSHEECRNFSLPELEYSLYKIHFPENLNEADLSRKRLAFNEVYYFSLYLFTRRHYSEKNIHYNFHTAEMKLQNNFIKNLPFRLTADQEKSIEIIDKYLASETPMNVLLQGDVGSGKTVVALSTSLFIIENRGQVAIMVPTEVLARQHYATAKKYIDSSIKIELITGSQGTTEKEEIYKKISSGDADIIIGTHALFQEKIEFKNLQYIIIDEQHKFGVKQRAALRDKAACPNLLVMSATPIPRSLCLTQYGDLDTVKIGAKPADRLPIKTLSFTTERINGIYNSMLKYLNEGRQIYFVLPLIEDSEKTDLKSAESRYYELKSSFPDHRVELIHSRIETENKESIMKDFLSGSIDILVSTTVIEVGVDVPNANVMIIEHAERFGLAQLHQLRGRVGRGEHQSFCILLHPEKISDTAAKRIKIMTETDDGFKIAEMDLKLRGSGQLTGIKQHGLNEFEFLDITRDLKIIETAREYAYARTMELKTHEESQYKEHEFMGKNTRSRRIASLLS